MIHIHSLFIGAEVTSRARVQLITSMEKVAKHGYEVLYADTGTLFNTLLL